MSTYMSDRQKTACIILAILCATGLIVMWSIMGYKNGIRNAQNPQPKTDAFQQAEDACVYHGGVPIKDGSGGTMTSCQKVK